MLQDRRRVSDLLGEGKQWRRLTLIAVAVGVVVGVGVAAPLAWVVSVIDEMVKTD